MKDAVRTLERTPRALRALLDGVPEDAVTRQYAPGSFSPYHVLGHLVIGERTDWIPRARIILEHGASRPFDPFDHRATIEPGDGPPAGELLGQFEQLRAANLEALAAMRLTEEDLSERGAHPGLGAVTLGELISAWAAHDLHHTAQICKGLAGRYAERVGPWREFMGILAPPT